LGEEAMDELRHPIEDFRYWSEALGVHSMPELEQSEENWASCAGWLLSKNLPIWMNKSQMSVGAQIQHFEHGDLTLSELNLRLAQVGLRLLDPREVKRGDRVIAQGFVLAIPGPNAPNVAAIFERSTWDHTWPAALRQAPRGMMLDGVDNRVRIDKKQWRCQLLDLAAWDAFNSVHGPPPPSPGHDAPDPDPVIAEKFGGLG
jgi:hypothetical protein